MSRRRPRVAHLLSALDLGGAEVVTLRDISEDRGGADHVLVICTSGRLGTLAEQAKASGVDVLAVDLKANPLNALLSIRRELKNYRVDGVVSHLSLASGLLLLAPLSAGIRTRVARIHSTGDGREETRRRALDRLIKRLVLRFVATDIVGVSPLATEFAKISRSSRCLKYHTIPNSVEPASVTEGLYSGRVVYIGRPHRDKNRAMLAGISRELISRDLDSIVVIGEVDSDISSGQDVLQIEGKLTDAARWIGGAGALVLTSRREGLPTVVLEAVSRGVPAVISDIPAHHYLRSELAGVTLVPLDAPSSYWASQLELALAADDTTRRTIRGSFANSVFSDRLIDDAWRALLAGK